MNMTPLPSQPTALGTLRAVLTGRAQPYTRPGSRSAIAKQARSGPVAVGAEGLGPVHTIFASANGVKTAPI